ncbi:hypothetical protein BO86DRAFT_363609 [Aspergillus japonicus CBS 114.51]|uniref:U6 snRNA phosphodiesterase n=1 Tax=Aspergillus japonicus CBS 114.51 TaxID=1448312 RepID=A0A8T8WZH9_ASPJA|nr:hypothetical protein BO86DRAFT_363609 [Aspergillus japonicus CBS 114.51]RAH81074.1 hypothetical protein BO86DRAFT_363609 [Aspergillus japonicus CBS 114.51]
MALVQYSESESESGSDSEPVHASQPPNKKLCTTKPPTTQSLPLPPLPAAFHDLYASSTRVSVRDDPSLHGGRKRVIPHIEGNWPTHLYLEWYASKAELTLLSDVILQIQQRSSTKLQSLLHSDLGAQLPLHISLSRPVVLRTEQRQSFVEVFQSAVKQSHVAPFDTTADSLDCVSNYEKTRWFYVLRVRTPGDDELNRLLRLSNRALARFDQPPLYEKAVPSSSAGTKTATSVKSSRAKTKPETETETDYSGCFHISLAWSLTAPSTAEKEQLASIDLRALHDLRIGFDCVKVKIGNQISSIPLN